MVYDCFTHMNLTGVSPIKTIRGEKLASSLTLAGKERFRSSFRARLCEEVWSVLRSALGKDFKASAMLKQWKSWFQWEFPLKMAIYSEFSH